jgi:hypothetical protein
VGYNSRMAFPFVPAYHTSAGHNLPISRIVIHGTVSGTHAGGARANAEYFQNANSGGSAHYIVDPGEIIKGASDDTICWHAPPNQFSLGVEFCDWVDYQAAIDNGDPFWHGKSEAQFNARWSLPDWDKMLRLGAGLVYGLAVSYSVPITRIGVAELLAGKHGLCGHVDVSNAWHQTDHHDPGPSFPWSTFLGYVLAAGKGPYVPPAPRPPVAPIPSPGVLAVDGGMGPATVRKWQQVMGTPADGVITVPRSSLVVAVQNRLNAGGAKLVVDGNGIFQDGRVYKTVSALQHYLGTTVDGMLSVPSSSAIKALQVRLNTGRF